MIRGKALLGGGFVLVEDGHPYVFDFGGEYVPNSSQNSIQYLTGSLEFAIISVLSSGGKVRLGLFQGNTMEDYGTDADTATCVGQLNNSRGYLRMLHRAGESEGVKFNQLIFVYGAGEDLHGKLKDIKLED